jgi:hypothetical protein
MKTSVLNLNKIKIISLVFLSAFSFLFFTNTQKASAASCTVESAKWNIATQPVINELPSDWYADENPPAVKIDAVLKNCEGEVAEISVVEDDTVGIDDDITELDDMEIFVPTNDYAFSISLTAGETECENSLGSNNDCEYFIKVDLSGLTNNYSSDGKTNGNLKYECDGACDENWKLGSTNGQHATAGECTVVSADFQPKGKQGDDWFDDSERPDVILIIKTKKCENQPVEVSITEADILGNDDIEELDSKEIIIDGKYTDAKTGINTYQIKMKAGETECENGVGSDDCEYFITVNPPGWNNEYDTKGTGNILNYDCDGTCDENWTFLGISGSVEGVILPPPSDPSGTQQTDLQATGKYDLLAPLPGFNSTFDIEGGLTPYLQILFRLLIGVAGLLSVIMIVLGGIEYMSTDAISGKEDGRERVTQAIIGLIIALGAWLLLNTINPNLLSLKFNPGHQTVSFDITSSDYANAPQTAEGGKYCNGKYAEGADWAQLAGAKAILPVGVTDNHNGADCQKVGQKSCTSIRGLNPSRLQLIKSKCPSCEVVITGGTECWLHSQNTNHQPGNAVTDLRATASLNKYIWGSEEFPNSGKGDGQNHCKDGVNYLAEKAGQFAATTGVHWHVQQNSCN